MAEKYYIGTVLERNGGMEYDTLYIFKTEKNPEEYSNIIAEGWRGGDDEDYDEDVEGWWSDGTLIFDGGAREIPKEDFDILKKYLSVL